MNTPQLQPGYYYIFLRRLRVNASVGVYDRERRRRQPLTVSVAAAFPTVEQISDRIEDVVNYEFLYDSVTEMAAGPHISLVETFCSKIIEQTRAAGALGVVVEVEKTAVYANADAVGCSLSWFKEGVCVTRN